MELSALTHSELIFIDPPHRTPEAVIGGDVRRSVQAGPDQRQSDVY